MSTQGQGISLLHQSHDAGYRLLELPPELESLIDSDSAPVLTLDSSSDTSAVLRTPGNSYVLRQKNTSNALILLSPHLSSSSPTQGLLAIATIHETVELDAVNEAATNRAPLKDTGSRGKWHEKFGKNR
ncbi:sister chromatid cohesion protein dcc1 domain-containing protein [Hirsutella rhossiliensis]|uniref:Sister chromatid cohesion protein dcc1 domain-containing protein n=1 Tax=Hirsutella rhossiliensis TaxID=111463 RepID=A0A9P8SIR0_9HYPO|nr:sister chromatid cohesion protein dcc1 domain-containing protein [Hirsutella rhossiliensis]KAH0962885.1 sister chromatid cohesion protein dcc1 domain-containing protein [Hirsutella rhossiliensis]